MLYEQWYVSIFSRLITTLAKTCFSSFFILSNSLTTARMSLSFHLIKSAYYFNFEQPINMVTFHKTIRQQQGYEKCLVCNAFLMRLKSTQLKIVEAVTQKIFSNHLAPSLHLVGAGLQTSVLLKSSKLQHVNTELFKS